MVEGEEGAPTYTHTTLPTTTLCPITQQMATAHTSWDLDLGLILEPSLALDHTA